MTLTNLKTVKMTAMMVSAKLTVPADRIGLGIGLGQANPMDSLSLGRFPKPHNPEPEQFRSRQGQSETQTPTRMCTDGSDTVPPASLVGYLPPGSSADRVSWPVSTTDPSRSCNPKVCVRVRLGSDCQSLARLDSKQALAGKTTPAAIAGK
jgi:hypothetical protein